MGGIGLAGKEGIWGAFLLFPSYIQLFLSSLLHPLPDPTTLNLLKPIARSFPFTKPYSNSIIVPPADIVKCAYLKPSLCARGSLFLSLHYQEIPPPVHCLGQGVLSSKPLTVRLPHQSLSPSHPAKIISRPRVLSHASHGHTLTPQAALSSSLPAALLFPPFTLPSLPFAGLKPPAFLKTLLPADVSPHWE